MDGLRLRASPQCTERDVDVLSVQRDCLGQEVESGLAVRRLPDQLRQDLGLDEDLPDGVVGQRAWILRPLFCSFLEVKEIVLGERDQPL
jgi:hypothetical protein